MAQPIVIDAEPRDRAGKGAARAARRAGMIPGVIYGGKEPPVLINLPEIAFNRVLRDPAFFTHLYDVKVGEKGHQVIARDVQLDPVMDFPIHVDFLRVSRATKIAVMVPVIFINEDKCPGLKVGGVLNVVRHEVELNCPAADIPDHITVDLAGFGVGETIHISAVTLPPNITPTITDRDFTVATIAAPSGGVKAAAEPAEGDGDAGG